MKNNKIVVGIIIGLVLLMSAGVTYAYFSATLNVEGESNDVVTTTGTLNITYTDGPQISMINAYPGDYIYKDFEVENTGSLDTYYSINWSELSNTIENDELNIYISCWNNENDRENNDYYSENVLVSSPIGNIPGPIVNSVPLEANEKQYCVLVVTFIETDDNQNYNQGKSFSGVINIDEEIVEYSLNGRLLDDNNNPLANASVTVSSEPQTTTTDENGYFHFEHLAPELHTLVASSNGTELLNDTFSIVNSVNNEYSLNDKTITSNNNILSLNVTFKVNASKKIDNVNYSTTSKNCFEFDSETQTITRYYYYENNNANNKVCPLDIVIPPTINGVEVKEIGSYSFVGYGCDSNIVVPTNSKDTKYSVKKIACSRNRANFTSVIIPDTVEIIGDGAFSYGSLIYVKLPNSVKEIHYFAFANNRITNINFPEGLELIEQSSFEHNKISSLTLPSTINELGAAAFNDNLVSDNEAFIYARGTDYSEPSTTIDNTRLISYAGKNKENIVIPPNVTDIGSYAFYGLGLTSITIPSTVTEIWCEAFADNEFQTVTILGNPELHQYPFASYYDEQLQEFNELGNGKLYCECNVEYCPK